MPYIYSTLSDNVVYTTYKTTANGTNVIDKRIRIAGGANVANCENLITPYGLMTEISDADLEVLRENHTFKTHVEHGFISIDAKKLEVEKVVKDMEAKDAAAPKTAADYRANETVPRVGKAK